MPNLAADEVRQLLVHPVVWPHLTSWLKARKIELSRMQSGGDDLPTYVMTPSTVTAETGRDQLDVYVRIFKLLPREAVAELVVAMAADPDLHGRRAAIAQAAMLVSVGHRLGWTAAVPEPADFEAQQGEETGDRIVAHVLTVRTALQCLRCAPPPWGDIWTPVTAGELEDGGVCSVCGTDLLIPQGEETSRG